MEKSGLKRRLSGRQNSFFRAKIPKAKLISSQDRPDMSKSEGSSQGGSSDHDR